MYADVHSLVIIYMDLGFASKSFCFRLLRLPIRTHNSVLRLSVDKIIPWARGDALSKFPPMIRH
jgi:hypothetical protein